MYLPEHLHKYEDDIEMREESKEDREEHMLDKDESLQVTLECVEANRRRLAERLQSLREQVSSDNLPLLEKIQQALEGLQEKVQQIAVAHH